ncbi:MAG: cation:proton antiporter [Verrucomicrobiales bacterium]
MSFEGWYCLLGGVMLLIVFTDIALKKLPVTAALLYLVLGILLGPLVLHQITLNPVEFSPFIERLTETAVIVSLFTAGLKLHPNLRLKKWRIPLRLAFLSMFIGVCLTAVAGYFLLSLPLGAAVLLGAILAPTDPVLASEVQLNDPEDTDRVRFGLTGEAGFNDGTAFPFVMLGLGLLGLHELGAYGWRWLVVDVIWAIAGGLGIGAVLGKLTGKLIVYIRHVRKETIERDEFIALGLIAFSYGAAVLLHTYGFLAVFAAALALRHEEAAGHAKYHEDQEEVKGKEQMRTVLRTNQQLERVLEIGLVLLVGGMLSREFLAKEVMWLAPLLFLLIRPISVLLFTGGCNATPYQKGMISWFGIRGIGSLYYLTYAIEHGLPDELAHKLTALVLSIMAISIIVHGISVTPIMELYKKIKPT